MTKQSYTPEELEAAIRSGEVDPNLPPAGYKREEVLAQRKDQLEEAIETQTPDSGTINPAVFEEDRDIQRDIRKGFLDLDIGDLYVLKWVNYHAQHSQAVWAAKAEGWKVVNERMVKNVDRDLVREDGTLRIGDVIAMYIRKDLHLKIERDRVERQRRMQYGAGAELRELAKENPRALKVHDDLNESQYGETIEKRAARRTALNHIGQQMKKGPVAGIPMPK